MEDEKLPLGARALSAALAAVPPLPFPGGSGSAGMPTFDGGEA